MDLGDSDIGAPARVGLVPRGDRRHCSDLEGHARRCRRGQGFWGNLGRTEGLVLTIITSLIPTYKIRQKEKN